MLPNLWLILFPAVLLVLVVQYFFTGRWEPDKRVRLFLGLLAAMAIMNGSFGLFSRLIDSLQAVLMDPGAALCSSLRGSCESAREALGIFSWLVNQLYLLQVAVAAALFLFWPGRRGWTPRRISLAVGLGGLALLAGAFASQSMMYFVVVILLMGGLVILVWRAWAWSGRLRLLAWAGLGFCLGLVLYYELVPSFIWYSRSPGMVNFPFFIMVIWPAFATSLAARMCYSVLAPATQVSGKDPLAMNQAAQDAVGEGFSAGQAVRPTSLRPIWREAGRRLALVAAALLLFRQLNGELAREGLWDQQTDGLTSVFIQMSVVSVGLAGAMVMAWSLAGWRKLGALAFAGLVLFGMSWAMENSWRLDPTEVTETNAARIGSALDTYRARNGYYPQDLASLVPVYLLRLPEPVMERGEGWCYQAEQDFYRLGYVWKPGYGTPPDLLKLRIAASAGQPPAGSWKCDEDLARLKQVWEDYWQNVEVRP